MGEWIAVGVLSYYLIGLWILRLWLPAWGTLEILAFAILWPVFILWPAFHPRDRQQGVSIGDWAMCLAIAIAITETEKMICKVCGNLASCTCSVKKTHKEGCPFRRAALLSFELACEHGFQACPKCDACTCKDVPVPEGMR